MMTVRETLNEAASPAVSERESSDLGAQSSDGSHFEELSPGRLGRNLSLEGNALMPPALRRDFDHSPPPDVRPNATASEPPQDHEVRSRRLWEMLDIMDRTNIDAVDELCRTIIRKDSMHIFEFLDLAETVRWEYIDNYMQSLLRLQLWKKEASQQSPYRRSLNTTPGPFANGWTDTVSPSPSTTSTGVAIPIVPFTKDPHGMRLVGYRNTPHGKMTRRHFIICPHDETAICHIRTGTDMGRKFVSTFNEMLPDAGLSFGESVDQRFLRDHHPLDCKISKVFLVAHKKADLYAFVQYVDRHGAPHISWLSRGAMQTVLGDTEADRMICEVFKLEDRPLPWLTGTKPEVRTADSQSVKLL
ncbi:hypothetical protein ZTR_09484 [Talaromyces verruculosus]|nr:hypothetical protein ZTR_09484 [Talaromyces verruculosus]